MLLNYCEVHTGEILQVYVQSRKSINLKKKKRTWSRFSELGQVPFFFWKIIVQAASGVHKFANQDQDQYFPSMDRTS